MTSIQTWRRRLALLAGIAGTATALPATAQTAINAAGYETATATSTSSSWSSVPTNGLYIAGAVGPNWLMGYELHPSSNFNQGLARRGINVSPGKTNFDVGLAGVLALGWGFGNGLRAELEGGYHGNNFKRISGFNAYRNGSFSGGISDRPALQNPNGTEQTPSLMVNALYDVHIAAAPWIIPYVGAGIGVGWTSLASHRGTYPIGSVATLTGNNSSTMFAYQAMLGAAIPIESVPGLSFTTEGRYFGTQQPKYNVQLYQGATELGNGSIKAFNNNVALLFGLRYAFNTPVPAVVPVAAAAAAARTYLVFFDWNKHNLTDRARQIIAEAAQSAKTTGTTRIEVAGHTDNTGTAAYNQRLSMLRAETVAAELVRRGVPRSEIGVTGYGFSRPLVATGPNVREPQNRRAEIILK